MPHNKPSASGGGSPRFTFDQLLVLVGIFVTALGGVTAAYVNSFASNINTQVSAIEKRASEIQAKQDDFIKSNTTYQVESERRFTMIESELKYAKFNNS